MRYLILLAAVLTLFSDLNAFCGFYVAKADAKLFNESSQVIMVRDGNHTVITMSNDFQGDVSDFAMVVPVPVVLQESDIRVTQQHIFDKFDAYTAPRMVEYYDQNPCQRYLYEKMAKSSVTRSAAPEMEEIADMKDADDFGVTVEATYTVGEYDILILSAKESGGLKGWLTTNGYKIPSDAEEVLDPYIKDGLKFFVVKVNLEEQKKTGYSSLRPIQIQFNSDRFMLPIRLGMANAKSTQDMIVYAFTRNGRVETANYRTTKLPTNRDIPLFVKEKNLFGEFYKSVYDKAWEREGGNSVMLEYAWNVSGSNPVKCDPCNTPPVTFAELREAGVWWLQGNQWGGYTGPLHVTRLHVRYGRKSFPQDLVFLNTPNTENFQGRYIVRHPATGDLSCDAGKKYLKELRMRKKKELDELTALTGWSWSRYSWYLGDAGEPVKPEPKVDPFTPTTPDVTTPLIGSTDGNGSGTPGKGGGSLISGGRTGNGADGAGNGIAGTTGADGSTMADGSIGSVEPVALGANVSSEGLQTDGSESSTDEFLSRAQQQASTTTTSNWMLIGIAGAMFCIGLLFRGRRRKQA